MFNVWLNKLWFGILYNKLTEIYSMNLLEKILFIKKNRWIEKKWIIRRDIFIKSGKKLTLHILGLYQTELDYLNSAKKKTTWNIYNHSIFELKIIINDKYLVC